MSLVEALKNQGGSTGSHINWHMAREEYVTGDESFSQMAARLGVRQNALEKHASARVNGGCTWGERREIFRKDVAASIQSRSALAQASASLLVREAQIAAVGQLVEAVLPLALRALQTPGALSGYEAVKATIALLELQRRIHGLDQAMRVEVTGKDGGAIEHDVALGEPLAADVRAIAERCLEALFGETFEAVGSSGREYDAG